MLETSALAPPSILLDFEKAALKAAVDVFPDVTPAVCLFHLGQSLWHRIQNEGLHIRMFTKMLLSLSFVPPEEVADSFDELNDNHSDELGPIYDY